MPNVLVTGASSGIGEATARYLSELGYTLILVARNENKLRELAAELPTKSYVFPYDLNDLLHIEDIFSFVTANDLKLDGMVHSAGITLTSPLKANDIEMLESVFRVNYEAFVELTRLFSMRKNSNSGASIVVLSSMASVMMGEGLSVYASSKAAVNASVKVFAKELRRREMRVNAILPARVKTPMTDGMEDRLGMNSSLSDVQPFGLIEPRDVAYLIEFLLSDKAKYITGAWIPISAGMM